MKRRGYVIQNNELVSEGVTKVGIELLGQLKNPTQRNIDNTQTEIHDKTIAVHIKNSLGKIHFNQIVKVVLSLLLLLSSVA